MLAKHEIKLLKRIALIGAACYALFVGMVVFIGLIGFVRDSIEGIRLMVAFNQVVMLATYCETDNAIYQHVAADMDDWQDHFAAPEHDSRKFEVNGLPFTARRILSPEFAVYVMTDRNEKSQPEGSEGYLWIPSGSTPTSIWDARYTYTPLANNIYCYAET